MNTRQNRYSASFKQEAVKLYRRGKSVEEICKGFGISDASLYKWVKKHKKYGLEGLENKTGGFRAGKSVHEAIIRKVVETKAQNPGMGSAKISGHIARFNLLKVCGSTVRKILNKYVEAAEETTSQNKNIPQEAEVRGRIIPRRKKPRKINKPKQVRYFERSSPNTLWQMDIMTFMLKGMYRIYLIGIIDDYSRYIVSHGLYRRQTENNVHEVLRSAIEKSGCPKEILTDNGRQFYSWRGKSKFSKFCIKTGIQHIRSRPYHPQTLGKIESFWRNLYQEFLGEVPLSSFEEAQEKISKWIKYYNHERVHLGIGGHLVPADRYFGVSKQVEQLIKEGSDDNEKELAKNPLTLKPSMYLVGKIGDKEIRLLAKDGEVVISDKAEKYVEQCDKNIVESEGGGTKNVTANVENQVSEKTGIDGKQEAESSLPFSDTSLKSQEVLILEEESEDGRTQATRGAENTGESGGQISPADKRAGETGVGFAGVEEGKDSSCDMPGTEHQQGSVLQMDAGSDDIDEGVPGTCGTGTESEGRSGTQTGAGAIEEGKLAFAARKNEPGIADRNTETGNTSA